MSYSIAFFICFLNVVVQGNRYGQLDPEIFRNLSPMPMPAVGDQAGNIRFEFNTLGNELVEVLSENATFSVITNVLGVERTAGRTIQLRIPSDVVSLRGNFSTEFHLPFPLSTRMGRKNTAPSIVIHRGTYQVNFTNFHLTLEVALTGRSLANPSFALQLCLVEFENVNIEVGLTRGEDRFGKIFVEDMLQLAGVNGYKGMFCNAMGNVLTTDNPVRRAILGRILAARTSKSM